MQTQTLRVTTVLTKREVQGLAVIADREGRSLREMVRCIVRQELIRHDLLPDVEEGTQAPTGEVTVAR